MTSGLVHFQQIFLLWKPIPLIFCEHPYCVYFSGMQHGNLRRMHMKIYCKCTSTVMLWSVTVTKVVNTAHSQGNWSIVLSHSEIMKFQSVSFFLLLLKLEMPLLYRYFEIVRCKLCGSRGTHRKCSNLKLYESDWICADCKAAVEGKSELSELLFQICLCRIILKLHAWIVFLPQSQCHCQTMLNHHWL